MTRRSIAILLVLCSILSAADTVRESVAKWKQNRRIEVVLNTGDNLIGRLGPVQPDRFLLKLEKRGAGERELNFDEVRSAKTKMTTARKWAIAAEVYAVLLVVGLILGK